MPAPAYAPLDDALEILAPFDTELTNGNFNHAPMVVEALCALDGGPRPPPGGKPMRLRSTERRAAA